MSPTRWRIAGNIRGRKTDDEPLRGDLARAKDPVNSIARQFKPTPAVDAEGEIAVLRLVVTQLEERIEALEMREGLAELRESLDVQRLSARLVALEAKPVTE